MLDSIANLIEASGPLVYILAPLFMVFVAILPLPAEVPAMVNGMVFGPALGTVMTWGGAMIGAAVSFELARRYGRPLAQRVLPGDALGKADRFVVATGWGGLLTARLIPAIAFTALNWGLGLSGVPRRTFLWTTAVGILPGAIVFTATGTGLGALYRAHPSVAYGLVAAALVVFVWAGVRYWRNREANPSRAEPAP